MKSDAPKVSTTTLASWLCVIRMALKQNVIRFICIKYECTFNITVYKCYSLKFGYIDLELDQRSTDGIIWKDLSEGPYMYIQNMNALYLQKRYDQH